MKHILILVLSVVLFGCKSETLRDSTAHIAPADMHNSRNSLDWAGAYEGVLPCADCPGIKTRLMLANDGSFEMQSQYLDREPVPRTTHGKFTWQADGNTIVLDANGANQRYTVGEGRLILLNNDGSYSDPNAPNRVLTRVPTG
jgi:uncharacterized lipoprotein NlpE involved in copper resistance